MTLEALTAFFGWMSVINIAILLLATIGIALMKPLAMRLHGAMFPMSEGALNTAYFTYLANFKLLTLTFSIAPWIALKLI